MTGIASRNDLYLSGHTFLDGGDTPLDESTVELYPLDSTNYAEQLVLSSSGEKNGTALEDCYVYLLDPQVLAIKAFDITSAEGKFTFSKLDAGQYTFFADYKGKHMNISNPVLEIGGNNDSLHINAVAGVETIDIQVEVISNIETMHP